jgi:integrase
MREPRQPSYRLHKPTAQAVVTIGNRDFYLGRHGSLESKAEYDRLISEWYAGGRMLQHDPAADLLVDELAARYMQHAERYYTKGGKPTSMVRDIRYALRPLAGLYGSTPARDFSPSRLKAVREEFIKGGLCRNEVNRRHKIILRCFRWAVSEEMVPTAVLESLRTVDGLKKGRTAVRETEAVGPVDDADVDAIEGHVSRVVWAMISVQRNTGARPGEVVIMRGCDISPDGRWYVPHSHKNEYHNKSRHIYLGPAARAVLAPWLRPDKPEAFIFSPYDSFRDLRARKGPGGRPLRPDCKMANKGFHPTSYSQAVRDGIKRANVVRAEKGEPPIPYWHPHQLRHAVAGKIHHEYDMDTARIVLGHSSVKTTDRYVKRDDDKIAEVMEKHG